MRRAHAVAARHCLLAAGLTLTASQPASADGHKFAWVDDTDVAAKHRAELELQLFEKNGVGDPTKMVPPLDQTTLGVSPALGLTDSIELGFPIELAYREQAMGPSVSGVDQFGVELRWRVLAPDPTAERWIAPLIRIAARRLITDREAFRFEAAVVAAMAIDRVRFAVDLGGLMIWHWQQERFQSRPAAGMNFLVTPALGVGAELYAEIAWNDDRTVDWASVGPSLSWVSDRSWLAFAVPIGIAHADVAPRVNWGVAF